MAYYSSLKRNDLKKKKKRNDLSSHKTTWKKPKCILLSERSQSEKAICYMIPTVQHSRKSKTIETVKKISNGHGLEGEERWTDRTQKIFRAVKRFCRILQQSIRAITHLSKPTGCTIPRTEPNYGHWVIMMCQCGLINCIVPLWWEMLIVVRRAVGERG